MAETFTPTLLTQINNQASSAVSVINANFQAIATALNDVLSRTAVAPNQMGAVLDMNNNRIINLPAAAYPTDPLRLEDLQSSTAFANVLAQATTASTAAASAAAAALSSAAQAAASAAAAATSVVVGQAGVLTGTTLAANVVNSSLTKVGTLTSGAIGSGFTAIPTTALAASTISGVTLGGTLATLTLGTHLTAGGTSYNGSTAVTVTSDATNLNTASTIVARDGSGNFSAGTITAALTGTASGNLPITGGTLTGELVTVASSTSSAGLNLPPGTAPTSPVNGDVWTTSAGLYVRVNGVTVGPLGTGGGGGGGSSVRQTVSQGPGQGAPSFLPATSASLSITSQNISTGVNAFVVTAAGGFGGPGQTDSVGSSTSNLTWGSLTASVNNYLGVTVSGGTLTAFSTTLAPIYQYGGTISVTNNQYTFDISTMTMWLGNGSTASQVYAVFVGEALAGASTVTSTVAYQYNGYYDSGYTNTLPAAGVTTSKNSNIGVLDVDTKLILKCITTDSGYAVGDVVLSTGTQGQAAVGTTLPLVVNRNTAGWTNGSANVWESVNKSGGSRVEFTLANWAWRIIVKRVW